MDDGSESAGEEVSLLRNHSKLMRRTIRNHANRVKAAVKARRAASSPPLPKPPAVLQFKAGVLELPGVTTRASNPRPQLPPSILIGTLTVPSSPPQPRGGNKRPGTR